MQPTLTVEADAAVAGQKVPLGVGLGHLQRTEAGIRLCIDLAAVPYDRRLYVWLRDVHALEAHDFDAPTLALPH